jgi:hypothetical protein
LKKFRMICEQAADDIRIQVAHDTDDVDEDDRLAEIHDIVLSVSGTGPLDAIQRTKQAELESVWPAILALSEDGAIDISGKRSDIHS